MPVNTSTGDILAEARGCAKDRDQVFLNTIFSHTSIHLACPIRHDPSRSDGLFIGSNGSYRKEHIVIRSIMVSSALALVLTTAASAAMAPAPLSYTNSPVIRAAEGCGAGFWRGPQGRCHPFAVNRACPPGYHLGPEGKKCWPN